METYKDAHSEELTKTKGKAAGREQQGKGAESRALGQTPELEGPGSELPLAGPGKFKKTALKLFGGKRSICTLPSFLGGGRSKGPGKGAAKKGLSKSKTHDGLQEACQESDPPSVKGANHNSPLASSPHLLPSSLNSHGALETETVLKKSLPSGPEKPRPERPSAAPRPKKGLKGLFSSIRRHRKSKALEPAQSFSDKEGLGPPKEGSGEPLGSAPQPITKDECSPLLPTKAKTVEVQGPELDPLPPVTTELFQENPEQLLSASSSVPLPLETNPEPSGPGDSPGLEVRGDEDEGETPLSLSGDQLNLLFGDVTSLKSFDSLTGCGDIIAEQDVDSISESVVSAERGPGRESAKRSSCLVTYQGGGEEMAMPEEMEEEEEEEEEEEDETMRHLSERADSAQEETAMYCLTRELVPHSCYLFEGAQPYANPEPAELLTPQSDQQESAPNSDEGYYDSNTPGPEDDCGDGLGPTKKDRLPRDSYSGDALYEFFEPCDSLTDSPPGDEGLFDPPGPGHELFGNFLSFEHFPPNKELDPFLGTMETEEERLVAIQRQLLYWELRRKRQEPQEPYPQREKPDEEHHKRLPGPCRKGPGGPPLAGRNLNSVLPVAPVWRDFSPPEECYEWKDQSSCLLQLCPGDQVFESGPEETGFEGRSPNRTYHAYLPVESPEVDPEEREEDPAMSFSQALVEFTSNGTLFSSLSGSSDSDSSFAQNLPVLPPMVTFDIADVEREGEGECEGPPEFPTNEEDFDVGYIPKEALDDLDDRFFFSSFRGFPWGVGSLPRHLGLPGLSPPPLPPPVTLNRRSRSLDTETLELELTGSQLAPTYMESAKLAESREGRWEWESPFGSCLEPPEAYDWPAWTHCSPSTGPEHNWQQSDVARTPFGSPACYGSLQGLAPRDSWNPGPQVRQQAVRPSHLDLEGGPFWNPQAHYTQAEAKKQAFVMPLESKGPTRGFSSSLSAKCKSVGVIQGVPLSPQGWEEYPKWYSSQSRGTTTNQPKGRGNHGVPFPPSNPSSAMNVSTTK
ncbi:APC membrane recruitment protein 1 [Antechinus flavipes]|uniref:APC membrane recruitment protein 1 n=1 Tax=Antechinus flavipes TaxID=38775 RepID=UPI002236A157|nr:APC membrane recruitment protein 1 [Antechinus flavipes]